MLGPTRHQFEKKLELVAADAGYHDALRQKFYAMQSQNVPAVFSLMHLARLSGVSWKGLRSVVRRETIETDYRVYPKDKSSGGQRWICVPSTELRTVQTWINRNILRSPGMASRHQEACQAYKTGSSTLENARQHAGASWIVKIDIKNFFESVSERQVYWVFRDMNYPALLSFEMARICTRVLPKAKGRTRNRELKWRWTERNRGIYPKTPYSASESGHLPQGAPTSPLLSNLVLTTFDKRITAIAHQEGATYTRYADDLVLSFPNGSRAQAERVLKIVRRALGVFGFVVNRKKTHVLGPGARKVVTGLVVNDTVPRLKSKTKSHIEVVLYHIETKGLIEHVRRVRSKHPISYLNHLSGLIQFARWVEPAFGHKAQNRLNAICEKNAITLYALQEFSSGQDFITKHTLHH